MKRYLKRIIVLLFSLSILFALAGSATATELKTGIGVVQARGGLRLRAKPDLSAPILTTAYNGDTVVVIRKVDDWYLVNYNLHIGYMHGDYLNVTDQKAVELGEGSVDPAVVNVRSAPSTSATLIDQLSAGKKLEIFGFDSGWYQVRYGAEEGYIRSDLITLLEKPAGNYGTAAQLEDDADPAPAPAQSYGLGDQIAEYAQSFVGYPYVYGGSSPSGFDCSGFMQYVYKHFGYTINRTATAQLADGTSVEYSDLRPGDIIYFGYGNVATHVGMYIGNGQFVHAQNSRTGVVISSLSETWYANRYLCAHRIVN